MAENNKNYDRFWKNQNNLKIQSATAPNITVNESVTGTGVGSIQDASGNPLSSFTIQVVGVGGTPTLWSVALEGSLDGVNFSVIAEHTTLTGDGENLYSGTTLFPVNYFRVNTTVLTLGPASSITVNVLGTE